MASLLFPLNPYPVIHWQCGFQSCSVPVLTSLPITQAASQTADTNSTRLLCKRTLINHQLNQTIYCVISRQLVNTSQILLTAVTAFPSLHIPIHDSDHVSSSPQPRATGIWMEKWVILYNKGRNQYVACPIIELFIKLSFINTGGPILKTLQVSAPKMDTDPTPYYVLFHVLM